MASKYILIQIYKWNAFVLPYLISDSLLSLNKITHIVYHEVDALRGIDQYWIKYTITDASGKYSSKTQKIEFENKPSEDEVTSFAYYDPD
jgi:hypothetical protein